MFETVDSAQADVMLQLRDAIANDPEPQKVNLGSGVYRTKAGEYHELSCIKEAKVRLANRNPGHDYQQTIGGNSFLQQAAELIFDRESTALRKGKVKVSSAQTISGTGAIHLAALFLSRCVRPQVKQVHVGVPGWPNYKPLLELVGIQIVEFAHLNPTTGQADLDSHIEAVRKAPHGSVFLLQSCCHNPSGSDLSQEQWRKLAREMSSKGIVPLFDVAYQGLGDGIDEDVFPVRLCAELGIETVICQSFSKNLGLYGERCGALHVVSKDAGTALKVQERLKCLIRWEFSSSPAYGSRLATEVLEDNDLRCLWRKELDNIRADLANKRQALAVALPQNLRISDNWNTFLDTKGLFALLPLSSSQCQTLAKVWHVYLVPNGRINIATLNKSNIRYVAQAFDSVIRGTTVKETE